MKEPLSSINFHPLTEHSISEIVEAFLSHHCLKPKTTFERYLKEQDEGTRVIWLAYDKEQFAGYVTLCWQSLYQPFRKESIPEIMDLNVLPSYRQKGIASQLLTIVEQEASRKSCTVGIGVGLYDGYGAAQKLYIKRGYLPDGQGITYQYKPIAYGQHIPLDDDLILWFTKEV